MTRKYELILDIAGVLAANFSPFFWRKLSEDYDVPYDRLTRFKKEIREELWTGKLAEAEFWELLCKHFPAIHREQAKDVLLSTITPLPAIQKVPEWSQYANIHLLSNHRIEWIRPIIDPIKKHLSSITLSSQTGYCKPNPQIYKLVHNKLHHSNNVWFVDDQNKNFKEASWLGWNTRLADENGEWIHDITQLLTTDTN
ncbi:hypothetical protein [Paenibacillus radicis (ex Gao et al. 2016)]|uniref:Haloacid dehalogenase n=1 Tax=Paenibacillus radicis (ex Gao et al. 2016) TaxID=1737354 RepID=A0A917M628_9BACL|nr:hypothetical protein [Paenibacillus radicis (ex Gao et al. 2016)]GGG79626.1 hypothetical protein GCM10010918_40870 [Paenibacillus radicis (ex Gao et al. 2016)]